MGIVHSSSRDEQVEAPIYPYRNLSGDSSSEELRLPRISGICSSIRKIFGFLSRFLCRRRTKTAIIPIQKNTESSAPLLRKPAAEGGESTTSVEQRREENRDVVVVFIPGFTSPPPLNYKNTGVDRNTPVSAPVVKKEKKKKTDAQVKEKVRIVIDDKEKWIKHYSSRHKILLVGEGDFSFSASLALAFSSSSSKLIATSLDSQEFLHINYPRAASNIHKIRERNGKVMHQIDATKMANHPLLNHLKFDRIIFNFPYAGLANLKNTSRESQLRSHRRLVDQFLKNAKEMITQNGEIHISHKTNCFHVEFKLESTASSHGLRLIEAVRFNYLDYPGYNTKCGFGGDNNFNCNPSKTYKFRLHRY